MTRQLERGHRSDFVDYFDSWKGAAILAVIAIHAAGTALTFPPDSYNWDFGLLIRQPVNFAVAMFLCWAATSPATGRMGTLQTAEPSGVAASLGSSRLIFSGRWSRSPCETHLI